jgi:hypothetical protein
MPYIPINTGAYTAAYAGAISGMAVSGWITNPNKTNYVNETVIAGAFAQAFDIAWNNAATLNNLELAAITAVIESDFQDRGPGPLSNPTFRDPNNWTIAARACVALILECDDYFTAEGINPGFPGGGGIPMPNGTVVVPQGANFLTEPGLGIWRTGPNLLAFAVNNGIAFKPLEIGTGTQLNSDPIQPSIVRYAARGFNPALILGTNETAHLFIRIDPTAGDPQQAGLYVDITANQLDTYGPAIKVIHAGSGDGIYVAQVAGNGSAFEAATWTDGSRGYISTYQVGGLANSTLFNALGGFATVPNFGMFYADLSFGNAFTIRRMDASNPGQSQIRLIEETSGRERFVTYQDGSIKLQGDIATGGGDSASPEIRLFGSIWDGAAAQVNGFINKMIPAGGDNNGIYGLYHSSPLGTILILQVVNDNAIPDSQVMVLGPNALGQYRGGSLSSPTQLDFFTDGGAASVMTLDTPTVNDDTAIGILAIFEGGALTTKKVTQGGLNTGGAGFRALVVPN